MKKNPYQCIRCGYIAQQKSHMNFHLYNLKKPCPCLCNNIDLTDEIKEHIFANRIYHIPKPEPVVNNTITQIINNHNTINNLIANMDAVEKLTKYAIRRADRAT